MQRPRCRMILWLVPLLCTIRDLSIVVQAKAIVCNKDCTIYEYLATKHDGLMCHCVPCSGICGKNNFSPDCIDICPEFVSYVLEHPEEETDKESELEITSQPGVVHNRETKLKSETEQVIPTRSDVNRHRTSKYKTVHKNNNTSSRENKETIHLYTFIPIIALLSTGLILSALFHYKRRNAIHDHPQLPMVLSNINARGSQLLVNTSDDENDVTTPAHIMTAEDTVRQIDQSDNILMQTDQSEEMVIDMNFTESGTLIQSNRSINNSRGRRTNDIRDSNSGNNKANEQIKDTHDEIKRSTNENTPLLEGQSTTISSGSGANDVPTCVIKPLQLQRIEQEQHERYLKLNKKRDDQHTENQCEHVSDLHSITEAKRKIEPSTNHELETENTIENRTKDGLQGSGRECRQSYDDIKINLENTPGSLKDATYFQGISSNAQSIASFNNSSSQHTSAQQEPVQSAPAQQAPVQSAPVSFNESLPLSSNKVAALYPNGPVDQCKDIKPLKSGASSIALCSNAPGSQLPAAIPLRSQDRANSNPEKER